MRRGSNPIEKYVFKAIDKNISKMQRMASFQKK